MHLAKTKATRDAAAMRCDHITLPGINRTPANLAANNNQSPNVGVVARHPATIPSRPRPSPRCRRWDGSEAQRLLKKAVQEGEHVGIAPGALRLKSTELKKFPLRVFQKHVVQEINTSRTSNYWQAKKSKRAQNTPSSIEMLPGADAEEGATDEEASV
jgi:hypothetical protein